MKTPFFFGPQKRDNWEGGSMLLKLVFERENLKISNGLKCSTIQVCFEHAIQLPTLWGSIDKLSKYRKCCIVIPIYLLINVCICFRVNTTLKTLCIHLSSARRFSRFGRNVWYIFNFLTNLNHYCTYFIITL